VGARGVLVSECAGMLAYEDLGDDFVEFEDIEAGDTLKRSIGSGLTRLNWIIFHGG
jgi:hypothetical protein